MSAARKINDPNMNQVNIKKIAFEKNQRESSNLKEIRSGRMEKLSSMTKSLPNNDQLDYFTNKILQNLPFQQEMFT